MRVNLFQRSTGQRRVARVTPLLLTSIVAPSLLAAGCLNYPDSDERLDDEIVATHYKKDAPFKEYRTFALSPEVVVFDEDDGEIQREVLDQDLADPVLEKVEEELTERGYTKVDREEDPDLAVTISVLSGTVTGFYTDYWGYYWGYPYYPYYPYYYTYSYNVGTVVVDAADLKNAPPPVDPDAEPPFLGEPGEILGKLDVIWSGLVYGVLGSSSQNVSRAVDGIDQAFKQSPYFRADDGD